MDITTSGRLPDMTGFEQDSLGAAPIGWFSPGYLLASRDLQEGETLYACLVRAADGKPVEQITFTADATNRFSTKWPCAFAQAINRDGRHIKAGGWTDKGDFAELEKSVSPEYFSILNVCGKAEINRIWYHGNDHRVFTSAAFINNWVQAHTLAAIELNPGDVVWVQVRDITSQYLHETHVFNPTTQDLLNKTDLTSFCNKINSSSRLIRAGRPDKNSSLFTVATQDNALWVPQCSELAVTVFGVNWRTESTVTATRSLLPGESIYSFALDAFSNSQLAEPHIFAPAQLSADTWPSEWTASLNSSPLNSYLRARNSTTSNTQVTLSQVTAPVRVFTTEPLLENWVKVSPPLGEKYQNNQSSMTIQLLNGLTQRPLQNITFTPRTGGVWDKSSWTSALCQYVVSQLDSTTRQYIRLGSESPLGSTPDFNGVNMGAISLWVPRHSGVEVDIYYEAKANSQQQGSALPLRNTNCTLTSTAAMADNFLIKFAFFIHAVIHNDSNSTPASTHTFKTIVATIESLREDDNTLYENITETIIYTQKSELQQKYNTPYYNYYNLLFTSLNNIDEHTYFPEILDNQDIRQFEKKHRSFFKSLFDNFLWAMEALKIDFPNIDLFANHSTALQIRNYKQFINRTQLVLTFPAYDGISAPESFVLPSAIENYVVDTRSNIVTIWLGGDKTSKNTTLVFRLSPDALMDGICILACSPWSLSSHAQSGYVLDLYIPIKMGTISSSSTVLMGYCDAQGLWAHSQSVPLNDFIQYEGDLPPSHLCADYGNTYRSEVFDISGQNSTGVDPRTGLLNAYYPVAVMTGLEGLGPTLDLGIHYTPTRANEAGLGDGWAFNFSSYDNRARTLTLSSGETVQLTDSEITTLKQGTTLKKRNYGISATFDNDAINNLTLDFVSGRRETLSPTIIEDNVDPSSGFATRVITKLNEAKAQYEESKLQQASAFNISIIDTLDNIFKLSSTTTTKAMITSEAKKNWEKNWDKLYQTKIIPINEELIFWQRPDLQLLPSEITAPAGGTLKFTWERRQGQFLLKAVWSGAQLLFHGDYQSLNGIHGKVTWDIWPGTDETYRVELILENYLLKTLTRTETRVNQTITLQKIQYGYSPDPTLDRVLTSVAESGGLREAVVYESEAVKFPSNSKPALPRVTRHMIQPGVGQRALYTTFVYSDNNYLGVNIDASYSRFSDSATTAGEKYRYSSTAKQEGSTTLTRTWNGLHLQVLEVEGAASGLRKSTEWTFASVTQSDPRFGLPTNISTTSQDADLPDL